MTLQTVPVAQNVSPEYSTGTGSTSFFLPVFENSSISARLDRALLCGA